MPKRECTSRQTQVDARQQQREAQIVEDRPVRQIERTEELAALVDRHSIVAAIAVEPDRDVIDHLREGEGDHDEIDAAGAQRQRTDAEREQAQGSRRRPLDEAQSMPSLAMMPTT